MAKPALDLPVPEITVTSAARDALDSADGDVRNATDLMAAQVRDNRALREALTEPLIDVACYEQIRMLCRQARRNIWLAPNYDAGGNGGRIQDMSDRLLLDMRLPVPGMPMLKDASRDEISAAIHFYTEQASDMAHKARWLTLVLRSVPRRKKPGAVLDEKRLRALQTEAENV